MSLLCKTSSVTYEAVLTLYLNIRHQVSARVHNFYGEYGARLFRGQLVHGPQAMVGSSQRSKNYKTRLND